LNILNEKGIPETSRDAFLLAGRRFIFSLKPNPERFCRQKSF